MKVQKWQILTSRLDSTGAGEELENGEMEIGK